MDLTSLVSNLCLKHGTRDPLLIAEEHNIIVLTEPLGSIRGYYSKSHRQKVIHINQDLDEYEFRYVVAHELGHAILHPNENTPFLRSSTYLSVSKLEREANQFAALLVVCDDTSIALCEFSVDQVAAATGLPLWLAKWRMEQISK